jgi:hypothetical protein
VLCANAGADDYRLHPSPTFTTGTAHVRTKYPEAYDSKACQTYLENLRYFAQRNTAMSCERPVAPQLMKVIQAVEWEDIDPGANAALLSTVMARASYGSDKGSKTLDYRTDEIRRGVRVFRRAKMTFRGTFDNGRHGPKDEDEPFQIVQYGINVLDPNNPAELWRCTRQRGGPEKDYSSYLKLYIVSPDLKELRGELSNYMGGGPTGGHLRTIRDNLYVEYVATNGNSILMQLRTAFPIGLESICLYLFKQSQ